MSVVLVVPMASKAARELLMSHKDIAELNCYFLALVEQCNFEPFLVLPREKRAALDMLQKMYNMARELSEKFSTIAEAVRVWRGQQNLGLSIVEVMQEEQAQILEIRALELFNSTYTTRNACRKLADMIVGLGVEAAMAGEHPLPGLKLAEK